MNSEQLARSCILEVLVKTSSAKINGPLILYDARNENVMAFVNGLEEKCNELGIEVSGLKPSDLFGVNYSSWTDFIPSRKDYPLDEALKYLKDKLEPVKPSAY